MSNRSVRVPDTFGRYWAWGDDGYYWVPGTWVMAPVVGYLWTPGYWSWSGSVYVWTAGYWGPHVGFYGGINYGFGYTGLGYEGGEWRGREFYYNRAVNNVNVTNITNVYNRTVVINNNTHVSYNGGSGGVQRRPTIEETQYRNERHLGITSAQQQHFQQAARNPQLLAKNNGGRPPIAATTRPAHFHHGLPARSTGGPVDRAALYANPRRAMSRNENAGLRSAVLNVPRPANGGGSRTTAASQPTRGSVKPYTSTMSSHEQMPSRARGNVPRPPQNRSNITRPTTANESSKERYAPRPMNSGKSSVLFNKALPRGANGTFSSSNVPRPPAPRTSFGAGPANAMARQNQPARPPFHPEARSNHSPSRSFAAAPAPAPPQRNFGSAAHGNPQPARSLSLRAPASASGARSYASAPVSGATAAHTKAPVQRASVARRGDNAHR